jgi:RNA polymerase sigma-70 factor (ECF subfamily)
LGSILEQVAAGDEKAVRACVSRYGNLVWSIALRLLKSRSEAEDAVQEIFVDIWRSARRFDPSVASEATFITMIARRRIYDRLRRADRRPETVGDDILERYPDLDASSLERHSEAHRAARAAGG